MKQVKISPFKEKSYKRLTKEEKEHIISLHESGMSQKDICDKTGRGSGTVFTLIKNYKNGISIYESNKTNKVELDPGLFKHSKDHWI